MNGIGGAARKATYAFTAPMIALGTFAVDAAAKQDAAMRNINSILGLTGDEYEALSEKAFDFAKTTRSGVTPATEALYEVFSAGVTDQEKAMAIWETSTRVAEAGLSNLSTTTNAITATMSAFNLEQDQATRVGNVWTRMVQVGVGSLDDFLTNSQKILPLSQALGISLEDMGASVAFLSQGGAGAAKAETQLAMMMSNLMKPTEAMKEAFSELGVTTADELIANFGSVGEAIKALNDVSSLTEFRAMFSKTGLEGAGRMVNNFDQMQVSIEEFNKGLNTATMDAWTEQSKSFSFQLDLMKTALTGVEVVIGEAILPIITPLVTGFTDLFSTLSETNPELVQLGVIFVGVVAAAAPLIWLATSFVSAWGLVIGAVIALGAAFVTNFNDIQTSVTNFVGGLLGNDGFGALKTGIEDFMNTLFPPEPTAFLPPPVEVGVADFITINPSESAISLWSFFEGEGYIEKFSWTEFQQMAKDAGWDGSAIDPGEVLNLLAPGASGSKVEGFWETFIPDAPNVMEQWAATFGSEMADGKDAEGLFGKLIQGIETAWPNIQIALDTMWTNIGNWFNTVAVPEMNRLGTLLISTIAGVFNPGNGQGITKAYNVVTGLFTEVPQAAEGMGADFQKNFPGIAASLTNLFQRMGAWIETEALPTISRSIGFLVGKVSILLGQGLGMIWDLISGNVSGGSGGAGALGEQIGDSVVSPFSAGIQDALAQCGVTNPADAFFTNLGAGLLVALAAWKLAPDFATGVIKAIGSPIVSAAGSGLSFVGSAITGAISRSVAASMAGGILGEIWLKAAITGQSVTAALGTAFTAAAGMWTATTAWVAGAAASLWAALAPAVAAIAVVAPFALAGLAIAATVVAVAMFFDENARNQAHAALTTFLDGVFGEGTTDAIEQDFSQSVYGMMADSMQTASNLLGSTPETDAKIALLREWAGQGMADAGTAAGTSFATSTITAITDTFNNLNQKGMDAMTASVVTGAGGGVGNSLASPVVDAVNNTLIAPEQFTTFSTNMNAALNESIASGNLDGQGIVDSLIVPLANGFITNFGAAAPATIAWTTFVASMASSGTAVDTAFILISQDLGLLATEAQAKMPIVTAAIVGGLSPVLQSLSTADYLAKNLAATLAALDGATVTLTTSVEGGTAVDGSFANGLANVPYDGFIAELHKGERVLTAEENGASGAVKKPTYNQGGGSVVFNIQGVTTFDSILKEARRRGYPIDRK